MGHADYLKKGDYNVICQRCGFKYKASETKIEWTGLLVCKVCYEERHPQDFVRGVPDIQKVPRPSPDTEPEFTGNVTPDDL